MDRFEYSQARTLRQAILLAQRYGEEARFVAGDHRSFENRRNQRRPSHS